MVGRRRGEGRVWCGHVVGAPRIHQMILERENKFMMVQGRGERGERRERGGGRRVEGRGGYLRDSEVAGELGRVVG